MYFVPARCIGSQRTLHQRAPGCQWYALAVRVPVWLTLGVAVLVHDFGVYRIRLALKTPETQSGDGNVMGRGFYRMAPRTHLLIGGVYILLGVGLIATSFGWNPLGNSFGPDTEKPAKDKAPTHNGVPIDQLPSKKAGYPRGRRPTLQDESL